jgi:hypothetical protein
MPTKDTPLIATAPTAIRFSFMFAAFLSGTSCRCVLQQTDSMVTGSNANEQR